MTISPSGLSESSGRSRAIASSVAPFGHVRRGRRLATHIRHPRPAAAILIAALVLLIAALIYLMGRTMPSGGLLYRLGASGPAAAPANAVAGGSFPAKEAVLPRRDLRPAPVRGLAVSVPGASVPGETPETMETTTLSDLEAEPRRRATGGLAFLSPDLAAGAGGLTPTLGTGGTFGPGGGPGSPGVLPFMPPLPEPAGKDPATQSPPVGLVDGSLLPTQPTVISAKPPVPSDVPVAAVDPGGPSSRPLVVDWNVPDTDPVTPGFVTPGFVTPGFVAPVRGPVAEPPREAGAVPEPATWLMMILGFLAVGSSLRRRRYA